MRVVRKRQKFLHWSKIVVMTLWLGIMGATTVVAQDTAAFVRFKNSYSTTLSVIIPSFQLIANKFATTIPFQISKSTAPLASNLSPRVYNYQKLGIFCKLDVKLDGITKWPVRFRLGTQEVVDRKEGKY